MSLDHVQIDGFRIALDGARWPAKLVRALLRRHYERMERRMVRALLAPGDRVLELGTSLGIVALGIARQVGVANLLTLEANAEVLALARANFAANGVSVDARNLLAVSRADAEKAGPEARFFVTPYFLSSSTLPHREDMQPVSVKTVVLEELIAEHRASAIVADIEGGEIDLFARAELDGVNKLLVELHADRTSVEGCLELIDKLAAQGLNLDADLIEGDVYYFARDRDPLAAKARAGVAAFLAGRLSEADPEQALPLMQEAAEQVPGNGYIRFCIARLLAQQDRLDEALAANGEACRLAPQNEDYHEQQGALLLRAGRFDEAAEAFRAAIGLAADRPLFHAGLGQALAGLGKTGEARDALQTALAMDPVELNPNDVFIKQALDTL